MSNLKSLIFSARGQGKKEKGSVWDGGEFSPTGNLFDRPRTWPLLPLGRVQEEGQGSSEALGAREHCPNLPQCLPHPFISVVFLLPWWWQKGVRIDKSKLAPEASSESGAPLECAV